MTYEKMGPRYVDYMPWRFPGSRLVFRGPRRRLEGDYIAFLGGTDTYGKFIERPFPMLVEDRLGVACVNLGWPNAGVDVFLNEPAILEICRRARAVILQLPGAQNMSNRFYTVHPRRNDRFIGPSQQMQALFPEVDFTEFHFTRHMLQCLRQVAPDRFGPLRDALQRLWVLRMSVLLDQMDGKVSLLWLSARQPMDENGDDEIFSEPAFITERMIRAIADRTDSLVMVCASLAASERGRMGMVYSDLEAAAAAEVLGPPAHEEAAEALVPLLERQLEAKR